MVVWAGLFKGRSRRGHPCYLRAWEGRLLPQRRALGSVQAGPTALPQAP